MRLKTNRRALASLYIVIALLLFTVVGPWVWTVDPTAQDLDQLSAPPGADRRAQIVEPYAPWNGVFTTVTESLANTVGATAEIQLAQPASTQAVRLVWAPVLGASGYRVYRNVYDPAPDGAVGLPLAEIYDPRQEFRSRLYWPKNFDIRNSNK